MAGAALPKRRARDDMLGCLVGDTGALRIVQLIRWQIWGPTPGALFEIMPAD
jgi:hypothetical protein